MPANPYFMKLPTPEAKKDPVTSVVHGVAREDEYSWMRATNWHDVLRDPKLLQEDILAHLTAENDYQAALLEDTASLRETLVAEMRGRIKEDDSSVPVPDGPFAYAFAYETGNEYPRCVRTPRAGGEEEVLLDGEVESKGKSYFRISQAYHSPDHSRLLWGHDDKGSELFTLTVRELTSGKDLEDQVEETAGWGFWDAQGTGFFYTRMDENHRPSRVLYHRLGTPQTADRLVYEEEDPGFFVGISDSNLHDWVFISTGNHETSEYYMIPAGDPTSEPRLVQRREEGLLYEVCEGGDIVYILTNADGAEDLKIVTAPVNTPQKAYWKELVPHKPGRLILRIHAYRHFLVRLEREDSLPRIVVMQRDTGEEYFIAFDEEAYSLGLLAGFEFDSETFRFTYSSMTTPEQTFEFNMRDKTRTLLKTQEIPSGHNPEDYITRRLMAPSHDGELVPISLVHRRDLVLDGTAPCLLDGYGAYGHAQTARFGRQTLSLVDRGFVVALAHIRGGKEKGYRWYLDGKREKKTNTFKDFIACGRYLVSEKYTAHDRLVAIGGSAGGILMGAVANMAPEDFAGIIASVPFVDVLNTMLDASLPLTPPEWPEWGNPIESIEDFRTILSYSPYDNVGAIDYPPILAWTGLTDPRVGYWEPAKWVARLRDRKTGENPVLLRTNIDSGHGGASGRFAFLEDTAHEFAFALKVVGLVAQREEG